MKPIRLLTLIEATSLTGPARNLRQFAIWAKGRVDLELATFQRGSQSNAFIEAMRREGRSIHLIQESGPFDRGVISQLRELAARLEPDIVQTHAVKGHFLARCAGWPGRWPWVAFHHGYTWPTFRARIYNQLDRWSLPAARRVITVSQPFQRELISRGVSPDRIDVVHNAIDIEEWTAPAPVGSSNADGLRRKLGISAGEQVIAIIGRLSAEKNHQLMLKALPVLRQTGLKVRLVCVGDGPERTNLEQQIRAAGLEDDVILAGQQQEVRPYYSIADVAVLPSRSEGSPNALLEAMALGVPAVATAVGGVPEIIRHGENALMVPADDADALARAVATILSDPARARLLSTAGRQFVQENFTPSSRVARLVEIYHSCLEPR